MVSFLVGLAAMQYGVLAVLAAIFRVHVNPAEYSTEAAYVDAWNQAATNARLMIYPSQVAVNALVFGVLAQRAGFGGRACLLILIPVIGTIVGFRILWRWTDIEHWERTVGYPGKSYFRWDRPNMTLRQRQLV